jgi:uncharacterized membrane protein YoaK (UPF0700 family)
MSARGEKMKKNKKLFGMNKKGFVLTMPLVWLLLGVFSIIATSLVVHSLGNTIFGSPIGEDLVSTLCGKFGDEFCNNLLKIVSSSSSASLGGTIKDAFTNPIMWGMSIPVMFLAVMFLRKPAEKIISRLLR